MKKSFPFTDDRGAYQSNVLTGAGERFGDSGIPWGGHDPSTNGRHWAIPAKIKQDIPESDSLSTGGLLDALDKKGLIIHPKSKSASPRYKQYLDTSFGIVLQDIWAYQTGSRGTLWNTDEGIDEDVKWLDNEKERVGYPTQKPLGLLNRVIATSSNRDDVVLDPFCGCATACVAADNLQREWVGIDISPLAVDLVHRRLRDTLGGLYHAGMVTARTDIPQRTDIEAPIPYRLNKHVLFGRQEGLCAGCRSEFPYRAFEVDHVIPQSRGGTDHIDNLQLLCSSCNRIKGNRTMEYLMARLAEFRQTA